MRPVSNPHALLGQLVGGHRLRRLLGIGGMGAVYEGEHEELGRKAAIKLLHAEYSEDKEILARFFNEARAVNIIGHPGLVNIYSFGYTDNGCAYIVMELITGETLRARLRQHTGPLGAGGLAIVRQVALVLAATHVKEIVHRDLKPENLMLVADAEVPTGERVKVLDFGIAKLSKADSKAKEVHTRTGVIMGSVRYISPEQCGGPGAICDRTDVYALGCILCEVISGQPPFVADEELQLIGKHLFMPPPLLRSLIADADPALEYLVAQMLAKRPEQRPTMAEVAEQLDAILGNRHSVTVRSFGLRTKVSALAGRPTPVMAAQPARPHLAVFAGTVIAGVMVGSLLFTQTRLRGLLFAAPRAVAQPVGAYRPSVVPAAPAVVDAPGSNTPPERLAASAAVPAPDRKQKLQQTAQSPEKTVKSEDAVRAGKRNSGRRLAANASFLGPASPTAPVPSAALPPRSTTEISDADVPIIRPRPTP